MTDPTISYSAPVRHPRKRPVDVLGIVAVGFGALAFLPALGIFLIGLIPSMNAIWWLGLVLIQPIGLVGAITCVLALIGVIVGIARGSRLWWSIIGLLLGIVLIAPIAYLYTSSMW